MGTGLEFAALEVATPADDDFALVCGFDGVDEAGENHYVLFQRDRHDSPEDWGIHFEFDDQGSGDYGCVSSCEVFRDELVVRLSKRLGKLEPDDLVRVRFDISGETHSALRSALAAIFRGRSADLVFHT